MTAPQTQAINDWSASIVPERRRRFEAELKAKGRKPLTAEEIATWPKLFDEEEHVAFLAWLRKERGHDA